MSITTELELLPNGFTPLRFALDNGNIFILSKGDERLLDERDIAEGYRDCLTFSITTPKGESIDKGAILYYADVKTLYGNLKDAIPDVLNNLGLSQNMFVLGNIYKMAGYEWIAIEKMDDCIVLQSLGITSGPWPSFNLVDRSINDYNEKMASLYDEIAKAEAPESNTRRCRGLYLLSKNQVANNEHAITAHKTAAANSSSFGADYCNSWLLTIRGLLDAYFISSSGVIDACGRNQLCVVAPAFNLNPSCVRLQGNTIVL